MDGCTAINFVKHVKIGFVQVGVVCAAWWHLRELSQQSNNNASTLLWVLWQNLDEDSFDMLYKNDCWVAIPDQIWTTNVPYERKINMLSSIDKKFMFVFLILRDLVLNLGFLFNILTHTVLYVRLACTTKLVYCFQVPTFEEFHRKTRYIHFGQFEIFEIFQKLLKYKENNKKICNTFDHNFKNIPLYNEQCIIRKVLFCIIRWCPYFKNVKNGA